LVPILNAALWTLAPPFGVGAMLVAAWRSREGGGRRGRHRSRTRGSSDEAIQAGIA
jgi:hypothetical protein